MEIQKYKQKPYEINYDDPKFKGMSRNKIKKICKLEYKEKMKKIWRQKEREKQKLKRQKKQKDKKQEQKQDQNENNKIGWKNYRKVLQQKIKEAPKVFIDAYFENQQDEKSLTSLVNQFCLCHSLQKKSENPLNLQIFGCGKITNEMLERRDYQQWLIEFHESQIDWTQKNLIYLSGDAEEEMENFDPNFIYIIGGLVDHNSLKNITKSKADKLKLKTLRLPLTKYVQLKRSPIITVQECFNILLNLHNKLSWEESILKALPKRKAIAINQFQNIY